MEKRIIAKAFGRCQRRTFVFRPGNSSRRAGQDLANEAVCGRPAPRLSRPDRKHRNSAGVWHDSRRFAFGSRRPRDEGHGVLMYAKITRQEVYP
ncbi:MAG: hypothetical protein MZU84_08745 [Sphingobacterium sp.]|nr:hypothetical protein [Sphingobacterium sp.]